MNSRRIAAHAAELPRLLSSPRGTTLLARMLGWSFVLPLLKALLPLPRLVRLMHTEPRHAHRDLRREELIVRLSRWVFRSRPRNLRDNCLERALVTYRYLGGTGAHPELVVGLSRSAQRTIGHVWVTVDGHPVHDEPEGLERFASILVFGSDGERLSTGRSIPGDGSTEATTQTPPLPPAERPR